jgi:hypothetical protein
MTSLLPIIFSIMGAFTYRWRGMNGNSFPAIVEPRIVRRGLYATAVGLAMIPLLELWAVLVPPLAYFGIVVGHGSYFPRRYWPCSMQENIDNEVFKWITAKIKSPMDEKTRFIGMALTGVSMTAPIGILTSVVFDPLVGLMVAILGCLKAVVYFVPSTEWDTEKAEWAWGAVSVGGLSCLAILTS